MYVGAWQRLVDPPPAFGVERKEIFLLSLPVIGTSEVLLLSLLSLEGGKRKVLFHLSVLQVYCVAILLSGGVRIPLPDDL